MPETKRRRLALLLGLLVLVSCAVLLAAYLLGPVLSPRGAAPQPKGVTGTGDAVVAEVAGTQIRERELAWGIPGGLFGITRERAVRTRLMRLAQNAALRKVLLDNQISVPEEQVTHDLDQIRNNPMSITCPCCQAGNTFEDLLRRNFYTVDDVKNELRNRIGLAQYLEKYWESGGKATGRPKGELLNEKLRGTMMCVNVVANKAVQEWAEKTAQAGQ